MKLSNIDNYEPLFGSWKVEGFIGDGAYGNVYWVSKKDLDIDRKAAVKIIDVGKDKTLRKLVTQEVENLLKLRGHPNIVSVLDYKVEQQRYGGEDILILMELLKGLDVTNMSPGQVVKLGVDICLALEACASNDIIHRDIKPANILLSKEGRYQLSDFGISRTMSTHGASTRAGTPEFIAPEVLAYKHYDARADICSLGLTMYCLLNGGKPPFFGEGDDYNAISRRVQGEQIPPIRGVSAGLNAIILKACAFEPDSRYKTARELRGVLENDQHAAKLNIPAAAVNITGEPGGAPIDAEEHFQRGMEFYDKEEYKNALEHYLIAAEQGHADAQCLLGMMYENGRGVVKDDAKAVTWYRKAAEQGDADAQCYLGWMYESGRGVAKDNAKAVEWYRKAAEQGNATAQCKLGWIYDSGRGVAKDNAKAVEWYRKAAEQGNATAQCNLGVMYDNGEGVVRDNAKAVEWYRKAAEQGHAAAQYNLGLMYANGRGVVKNDAKAVEWYRKAAEQGHARAQYNLGWMYANGSGVVKNDAKAVEWYRKAAEQGDENAQAALKRRGL